MLKYHVLIDFIQKLKIKKKYSHMNHNIFVFISFIYNYSNIFILIIEFLLFCFAE